jgi:hypothetical protein
MAFSSRVGKVQLSMPPVPFASSSRLVQTLMIRGVKSLDSLTETALAEARAVTSRALGIDVRLQPIECFCMDDTPSTHLIAITSGSAGPIIGVYEVMPYGDCLRCNRVCDDVVQRLLDAFGKLGPCLSNRLQPCNKCVGSKVLPSGLTPDVILGFC